MSLRTPIWPLFLGCFLLAACGNDNSPSDAGVCPPSATGTTVSQRIRSGTLCGTLQMPSSGKATTVALIVPGSGPTDRDGNGALGIHPNSYALLADALAAHGIASVRYDKRGLAASANAAPSETELRPADGADDVEAWLTHLNSDDRFAKTVVIGHSEGSLLGILAMEKVSPDAFVSIAGPGRKMVEVFHDQLARSLTGDLLDQANHILEELAAGRTVADVPAILANAFRPSVQPYLIALLQYEPAKEFAKLTIPTLIAQGTTDVQVKVDDARTLAAARPDAQVLIVDGMSHTLKVATLDDTDQMAALTDPSRPIATALVEGVDAFLDALLAR